MQSECPIVRSRTPQNVSWGEQHRQQRKQQNYPTCNNDACNDHIIISTRNKNQNIFCSESARNETENDWIETMNEYNVALCESKSRGDHRKSSKWTHDMEVFCLHSNLVIVRCLFLVETQARRKKTGEYLYVVYMVIKSVFMCPVHLHICKTSRYSTVYPFMWVYARARMRVMCDMMERARQLIAQSRFVYLFVAQVVRFFLA